MLKAFDLNADLPSLAILHKKASHPGGFFVSGVRVEHRHKVRITLPVQAQPV